MTFLISNGMGNKLRLSLIIGAIALLGAGCATGREEAKNAERQAAKEKEVNKVQNAQGVEITKDGFLPADLTISVGTTVIFINKDTVPHWPASGVHPTHEICKGFDALAPVASGGTYSHTFNEVKVCPMHDHLNPSIKGKIMVVEK